MRRNVLILGTVVLVLGTIIGCETLKQTGLTPKSLESASKHIEEAGRDVGGNVGAVLALIGLGGGAAATAWGKYERGKGKKYKRAFKATSAGIDKFFEGTKAEGAIEELKSTLVSEQAKAETLTTVARLRGKPVKPLR